MPKPTDTVLDAPVEAPQGVRVLVIDDEPGMRQMLARELTLQGYEVETAEDGVQGMKRFSETVFQLVLCDIKMPNMGGLETLEKILTHSEQTDVIMMTGYATVGEAVTAMKNGAYDFLQKPFNLDELSLVLQQCRLKNKNRGPSEEVQNAQKRVDEMQNQLIQSEKMSGIGQLAAGVVHEINNPLAVILGYADAAVGRLAPGDPMEIPLKTIKEETLRCRNLVQNLLGFSRTSTSERVLIDMNPMVESALSLVRAKVKLTHIELKTELGVALPRFRGDSNQLQQVLINLATNAIDAMGETGLLTIQTGVLQEGPLPYVYLKMIDTGPGIPDAVLPRIFEPFFTTKPVGKGTGLGLSLIHDIVERHLGTINVESRPGRTAFHVQFPVRNQLSAPGEGAV